ncbi:hypothetical protein [Erythrobacter aureus]|uniref:Uncharacterized protein n=1 Tax=Erythrobacter aureus TaxID=2182384 RepID=A0A345YII1_9SPHN|nr:hypothetical protein [Erythrobacter aureus]AXK43733.1 hypothetical protein DVR09_14850 [Erythrobacter aureus]
MIFTATVLGLLMAGTPRDFVEVRQEVQVEYDWSPTVGRQAEPEPEAFVPVRYLTPEQRAEPIIVEPAPVTVYPSDDDTPDRNAAAPNISAPFSMDDVSNTARSAAGAVSDYASEVPSYITSMGNGSATGSTAIPDYGVIDE